MMEIILEVKTDPPIEVKGKNGYFNLATVDIWGRRTQNKNERVYVNFYSKSTLARSAPALISGTISQVRELFTDILKNLE